MEETTFSTGKHALVVVESWLTCTDMGMIGNAGNAGRKENRMAEYIDRERLKEAFNADLQNLQTIDEHTMNIILLEIDEAPTADVAPVVRCRKCIHWHDWGACGHPDNGFDAPSMGPDDFCSKGEPKNELE